MKKSIIPLAALTIAAITANAASGIFGAYVGITPQGGSETDYGENQPGANFVTGFNGSDLGTINLGETLTISSAEVLTFKNDFSDVFGTEIRYRVYETGSPTGSFTNVAVNFGANATFTDTAGNQFTNGGDQSWSNIASTPDIANGLAAGDYTMELFWYANTSDGDQFVNNGGSNYTATFTVVPEPGTFALLAGILGFVYVALRRRVA